MQYTILHTNDFHDTLKLEQASRLRQLRDDIGTHGLLLDAGDAVGAGNITFRPAGEPILERMTEAGYSAMTVGNREFHFSRIGFFSKLSKAGFPVLCANVRPINAIAARDPASLPTVAFTEFLLEGNFKVVVFGVTVPMITEQMLVRKVSAYVFDDPIKVACDMATRLRESHNPDLLIAMTHIGIKQDERLAEACPVIDIIIGGHTHVTLPEGQRIGNTLLVQAASHGRYYGRIDIDAADGCRSRLTARLEEL